MREFELLDRGYPTPCISGRIPNPILTHEPNLRSWIKSYKCL
jgi:hypothetical protein